MYTCACACGIFFEAIFIIVCSCSLKHMKDASRSVDSWVLQVMYLPTRDVFETTRKCFIAWQCAKVASNSPSFQPSLKLSFNSFPLPKPSQTSGKQRLIYALDLCIYYAFIYNQCMETRAVERSIALCMLRVKIIFYHTVFMIHRPWKIVLLVQDIDASFGVNINVT